MKHISKFLPLLSFILMLLQLVVATSGQCESTKLSRGEQILNDESIITPGWANIVKSNISNTIQAKVIMPKAYQKPIQLAINKYGESDKITRSDFQDFFSHKLGEKETLKGVKVYHYDNFGYVVDENDKAGNIVYIFWSKDGIHKPHKMTE